MDSNAGGVAAKTWNFTSTTCITFQEESRGHIPVELTGRSAVIAMSKYLPRKSLMSHSSGS
jgi:hypothetical protein